MPNKARINKWVNALRSGKYKQGRNALRPKENGFCCLGVACDLYEKESGKSFWVRNKDFFGKPDEEVKYAFVTQGSTSNLPKQVARWLGISTKQNTLIRMNDDQRKSFKEIANELEKRYLTK